MQNIDFQCSECNVDVSKAVDSACEQSNVVAFARSAGRKPRTVVVTCSNKHRQEFRCPSSSSPPAQPVKGIPLTEAEVTEWEQWKAYIDPQKSMERIQKYGEWLFKGSALILTLVAGASTVTQWPALQTRPERVLLGLAIFLLGLAFAAATLGLAPRWRKVTPDSRDSVLWAFGNQLNGRRRWITAASLLFAGALVAAGGVKLAPDATAALAAANTRPPFGVSLKYDLQRPGTFKGTLIGRGLAPRSPAEIRLELEPFDSSLMLPRALHYTDGRGDVHQEVTVATDKLKAAGTLLLGARWLIPAADSVRDSTDSAKWRPVERVRLRDTTVRIPLGSGYK